MKNKLIVIILCALLAGISFTAGYRVAQEQANTAKLYINPSSGQWTYEVTSKHKDCRLHVEDDAAFKASLPAFLECMKQYEPKEPSEQVNCVNMQMASSYPMEGHFDEKTRACIITKLPTTTSEVDTQEFLGTHCEEIRNSGDHHCEAPKEKYLGCPLGKEGGYCKTFDEGMAPDAG